MTFIMDFDLFSKRPLHDYTCELNATPKKIHLGFSCFSSDCIWLSCDFTWFPFDFDCGFYVVLNVGFYLTTKAGIYMTANVGFT